MNHDALKAMLEDDEDFVPHAYQDHLGYWTIGIGRLIDKRKGGGITRAEALYLLDNDIARVVAALSRQPWWAAVKDDEVRRNVIISMAFQMGVEGLLGFVNTLRAVSERRWKDAAAGMAASKWATQTPDRAARLIGMMDTGVA